MSEQVEKPTYKIGEEVWLRCGAWTCKRATILPYASTGRRTRTICVKMFEGGKERWVHPHRIEKLEEWAR